MFVPSESESSGGSTCPGAALAAVPAAAVVARPTLPSTDAVDAMGVVDATAKALAADVGVPPGPATSTVPAYDNEPYDPIWDPAPF